MVVANQNADFPSDQNLQERCFVDFIAKDLQWLQEARRIAYKTVGVADMDERVNRAVIVANHEANQEAAIL
ncbi:hypothetical protein CTI12_AA096330 [Artemisia annua]|uniref:Uncharacterized protein n=1 Tax=Artemisia annua TaxID=35608 RepID=A0A2U1PZ05_ARTAN|nr:hypothetical protein CTI12_AA096330 [Artemisia annua]